MSIEHCYCGSNQLFSDCCESFILGKKKAESAEQLMRSRYSAYATLAVDYLLDTTHVSTRKYYSKKAIRDWALENNWLKLEIHSTTPTTVDFSAHFMDRTGVVGVHQEHSTFLHENGTWYFVDGE